LFRVVGIVARLDREEALRLAGEMAKFLKGREVTPILEENLARAIGVGWRAKPINEMRVDLLVTIGGDGTILRACLQLPNPQPPILAVNMGVRGFLTEVPPSEGLEALDQCLRGDFTLETCTKIAAYIGEERLPDALNEVLITSEAPAKLLHLRLWRDGEPIAECRSDGVVVASQVGSTGYSLSAGGPVLDPDLEAFVLTPICPLTVFHPIVFPLDSVIGVELLKPKRATVVVDGHYRRAVGAEAPRVVVTRSEHKVSFIRLKSNFYERLKTRLLFSGG